MCHGTPGTPGTPRDDRPVMFRLLFLVLMSSCQPCLIWREKSTCKLRTVFTGFFSSNDNLMIWDDMIILKLIIPRIWGLNRLKNMISDINRYLHKALSPRNHFQIWSLFHRRGFTNFSCFDFEFKTERLAGRMCLCALIGCSTKHCFGLRFCKMSKYFLNVPKWSQTLKAI